MRLVRKLMVLMISALGLAGAGVFVVASGSAAPDPVNCTGYPEPRIYLENQSWWTPQAGPASHPGTGQVGHIHVGACFPLYQTISGTTMHLDVKVQLHNIPGTPTALKFTAYNDRTWEAPTRTPPCSTADCEYWVSFDVPISSVTWRGWREFAIYQTIVGTDAVYQRNWQRFPIFLDYPSKPLPPLGQGGSTLNAFQPGGDSWYGKVIGGSTGAYARAVIQRSDLPWSEATGALRPVSGIWTPTVRFEARQNFVYVDPALHAVPPSHGTVVYEQITTNTGYHTQTLSIDTTTLTNGVHRLLIGTGNVGTNGTHSGVLVVPFLVANA